jgi:hypothetical protein
LISSASSRLAQHRPQRGLELARLLVEQPRAHHVGRDEVGGELDALELPAHGRGQGLDRHRLGEPRHALDEQVPPGQQGDGHAFQQHVLTDDGALDLIHGLLERMRHGSPSWAS